MQPLIQSEPWSHPEVYHALTRLQLLHRLEWFVVVALALVAIALVHKRFAASARVATVQELAIADRDSTRQVDHAW